MMRRLHGVGLALVCLFMSLPVVPALSQQRHAAGAATATAPSASLAAARADAERIRADKMKEILYFISSDEMAGRDTPSPGLDKTAKYIAERLKKLKVKPAGDNGSYFQTIALRSTQVDAEKTRAQLGERVFAAGEGFLPAGRAGGDVEAPIVYAGHGWLIKSKNVNAYDGLDVRDKIVVVSGNGSAPPPGVTAGEMAALPGGDWESPVSYARKHGAKALVLIPRNYVRRWRAGVLAFSRPSYYVERLERADDDEAEPASETPDGLPVIIPSGAMLTALFEGERADGAAVLKASIEGSRLAGFDLAPSKRLRLSLALTSQEAKTQNVVGIVEGRDPVLRKEYVALGAHYDHVAAGGGGGGCRPVGNDTICNGADDDGSGVTALLTMAEAFTKGRRPRRSILFVWHTGEEQGLWGSEYFTEFPTVPLKQVVAQLNIDMIGRSKQEGDTNPRNRMLTGPEEIYVIGSKMMSTELGALSEAVNRGLYNLKFNYHYDEPGDPERLFYRSDHFNYARKGVPIIFYFDGVHEDYHRPTDHADKIDYQKMEKITRTIFVLAAELANSPRRPAVDKQLPAELMER